MKSFKLAQSVLDFLEDKSRDNEDVSCLVESTFSLVPETDKRNVSAIKSILENNKKTFNYIESGRVFVVNLCKTEIAMISMFDFVGYISLNRTHKVVSPN